MMSFSHSQIPPKDCIAVLFSVLNDKIVTDNGANTYEYFRVCDCCKILICYTFSVLTEFC